LTLLSAALLLAGCGAQPAATSPAAAIVDSLYRARQPFQGNGAPSSTELATMRPWLSAELARLLAQADSIRAAETAAHPDEKPPFVEGDLFSSLFEGPTGHEVKAGEVATAADSSSTVPVHFTFSDQTTAQKWTDTAVVISEGGKLVVSDVRYGGTWDFANRGSLVASLRNDVTGTAP
jgi:hypothetical protein